MTFAASLATKELERTSSLGFAQKVTQPAKQA
jgi:hypothetical protein